MPTKTTPFVRTSTKAKAEKAKRAFERAGFNATISRRKRLKDGSDFKGNGPFIYTVKRGSQRR